MVNAEKLCSLLKKDDFKIYVGVPCSWLTRLTEYVLKDSELYYIPATREDEAIGIACGLYLGGKKSVIFMQNSGFGNAVNAFTSLALLYGFQFLVLMSWRGYRGKDAPEHLLMGRKITKLLKDIKLKFFILPKNEKEAEITLFNALDFIDSNSKPVVLVIKRGVIK